MQDKNLNKNNFRTRLRIIIFGSHTPLGKLFDVVLLVLIILSLALVILESIPELNLKYGDFFIFAEWVLTIIFTIEYLLRLYSAKPLNKYVFSFYGFIDLLSVLPSFLALIFVQSKYLIILRTFRLLRVFRVFKLIQFLQGRDHIVKAMRTSMPKIIVFLVFIVISVTIIGTGIYIVESNVPDTKFTNIPKGIYWAIVTLTTVGYGDLVPTTTFGQFLASILMILGYAIIAVPTGIISADLVMERKQHEGTVCQFCDRVEYEPNSHYCRNCGHKLHHQNE